MLEKRKYQGNDKVFVMYKFYVVFYFIKRLLRKLFPSQIGLILDIFSGIFCISEKKNKTRKKSDEINPNCVAVMFLFLSYIIYLRLAFRRSIPPCLEPLIYCIE